MAQCGDIMGLPNMFPDDCTVQSVVRDDSPSENVAARRSERVVTALPPEVADPHEREIIWRSASWKRRLQKITCRDCGMTYDYAKERCPNCRRIRHFIEQSEPRKRWHVGFKKAPFLAKLESGESIVIFTVAPGHRILI